MIQIAIVAGQMWAADIRLNVRVRAFSDPHYVLYSGIGCMHINNKQLYLSIIYIFTHTYLHTHTPIHRCIT